MDYWEAYQATKVKSNTSDERQEENSKESFRCSLDDNWVYVLGEDMIGAHICAIAPLLQNKGKMWISLWEANRRVS